MHENCDNGSRLVLFDHVVNKPRIGRVSEGKSWPETIELRCQAVESRAICDCFGGSFPSSEHINSRCHSLEAVIKIG